jgi:hypothetical protein
MTKKLHGRSFAADRELVELAKNMDLAAIANRTGRTPAAILRTAMKLGVSIKGKPKQRRSRAP